MICKQKQWGWLVGAGDGKKLGLSWDHLFSIPTHPNRGCSKLLPNLFFLERVSFHHEKFDVTNFRLLLGVGINHVVIFIKKYLVNLYRIAKARIAKDTHDDNVGKIMPTSPAAF